MNIYLAGDLRTNWRDAFREQAPDFTYLDPQDHYHIKEETAYTFLDLLQLEQADLVVANLDPANPSLYGTSLEIGYAVAQGKSVLIIDQLTPAGDERARWFGMARSVSHIVVASVADAIDVLNAMVEGAAA